MRPIIAVLFCLTLAAAPAGAAETPKLDEQPAGPDEWGYHPALGAVSQVTPPAFTWRPQKGIVGWEIQCAHDKSFSQIEYETKGLAFNVHCPTKTFPAGAYTWRYRGSDATGATTNWSEPRTFAIAPTAKTMLLPPRDELLARIPKSHPRLFVRPEEMAHLRDLARGNMKKQFDALVARCDNLLTDPPSTHEPPKYAEGMEKQSEEWLKIWWGNRGLVLNTLDNAALLAFTRLLGGKDEYGQLAKRLLLESAKWDPKGSTGFRYNDEAGMPYAYCFSRAYTFLYDLLSEEERAMCRKVMEIRGKEMYERLCPRILWKPYESHANRAWHFLGEIAVALHGEIPQADDWTWFAMNYFTAIYPVWADDDGGWHEGSSYWASYQERFGWWADIMREALGVNAYDKPYFSQAGYYAMYLMPPGITTGGLGDLAEKRTSQANASLMRVFSAQARNPYWQWYADRVGAASKPEGGYIGFIRGALPKVEPKPPSDLPASRLFRGTGQVYMNTDLTSAGRDVQIVFKSSPFGTQSHGYDANNAFLLWAYGQPLLIKTGRRDYYGSAHHKGWMWSPRSENTITVGGFGQAPHSSKATGEIAFFKTTPSMDLTMGEIRAPYVAPSGADPKTKAPAWKPIATRFSRAIIFVKPELVVIYDRLEASQPSTFQYWLHAVNKIEVRDQRHVRVQNDGVVCDVAFLAPDGLTFTQTDQYDPNPRERIKVREWHLTAATPAKEKRMEFVALYRPHRATENAPIAAELKRLDGGYALSAKLPDGEFVALLPTDDKASLEAHGLKTRGVLVAERRNASGAATQTLRAETGN